MNATIEKLLATGLPVILDGAWGTELQERGLPLGEHPDAWNLNCPDKVREVATAYVQAGSQIILTNTFGANSILLERHNLQDKADEINRAGAKISKEAAGENCLVFGSIGPTGKMIMMGDVPEEDVLKSFTEQAKALADGGADGLVIETMTDLVEAKLAVEAARRVELPVVVCLVFDSGPDGQKTMMGVSASESAIALTKAGADVIGSNCGNGIEGMLPLCRDLKKNTDLPIWIKANAGLPEILDGKAIYKTAPDDFAKQIPALIEAGASFIGGCCGTSPEFIKKIRKE
jgi:5-methyltetrahydrofolate--homocysteine methyltransferase